MAKKKKTRSTRAASASASKKKTTKKKAVTNKKVTKKKVAAKKVTKKKAAKKTAKKSPAKKAPAKKKTTKKKIVKKVVKKKVAKKAPTKKSPPKKSAVNKAPAEKAPAKKAPAKTKPVIRKPPPPLPKTADQLLEEEMEKEWTIPQLKRVKTGFKKKELDEYLRLLREKRSEIIGNVHGMEDARNAALADIAHMPLHMADVGSDNFEQEFTLGLMEAEREMLGEIEEAIVRMREGYYGVCLESGRVINRMRLEFAPWAKYCIDVAKYREKRGW